MQVIESFVGCHHSRIVSNCLGIKRCNKCQEFVHYVRECKGLTACGLFASEVHEAKYSEHKDAPNVEQNCAD